MISYVVQRVISIVALAFGISVIVFLIIRLIPGDPVITLLGTSAGDNAVVDRLRQQLGLDMADVCPIRAVDLRAFSRETLVTPTATSSR